MHAQTPFIYRLEAYIFSISFMAPTGKDDDLDKADKMCERNIIADMVYGTYFPKASEEYLPAIV
jgi:hypothetical protein